VERLRDREERKIRENNIRKRQEDVEHKTYGTNEIYRREDVVKFNITQYVYKKYRFFLLQPIFFSCNT